MSTGDLNGLVALVTGAAAGIGQATARELVAQGARVTSVDLTSDGVPEQVEALVADLRHDEAVREAVRTVGEREGRIDVLVNNAGVSYVGGVEEGSYDEWNRLWDINVLGYVRTTRAALPYLRRSPSASIVMMSSCTADSGIPQRALYSATKGAIQSMSLSMAADLALEGIRVNCVSPGTVDTPFMAELAQRAADPVAQRAAFEARQPIGRMVTTEEVAAAVAYLASPRAGATVGTVLTVDGGLRSLRLARS